MAADLSRLRTGEKLAAAAAVLLFIDLFLSWYGVKIGGGLDAFAQAAGADTSASAWTVFSLLDLVLLVVILVALAWAVLTATQRAPALPVAFSVIVTALGALATLLVLYRILNQPGPNEFVELQLGAFLGFVCTLALAAGAWQSMRDESWPAAPVEPEVHPAPPPEGTRDPSPPPEAEPRA